MNSATRGNWVDVHVLAPLFGMVGNRIEDFLADRGYNVDAIREEIAKADVEAVKAAERTKTKRPT